MTATAMEYRLDTSRETLHLDLSRLLAPQHVFEDVYLQRWIARLEARFDTYRAIYPYGLWAPGLAIIPEMCALTELLLPLEEIRAAICLLCRRALRLSPQHGLPLFFGARSWLDVVSGLPEPFNIVNPARLLDLLVKDQGLRTKFLFAAHLPKRHGGGFSRYPAQLGFLSRWLKSRRLDPFRKLRCLDAACGSGEGTCELALRLLQEGFSAEEFEVRGLSLDPLEVFAAAHAFFPHDARRQDVFRNTIEPLVSRADAIKVIFSVGDIAVPGTDAEMYDIVLCNGLLGGPMLNDGDRLRKAVKFLSDSVQLGGVILAEDRFHAGWQKKEAKQSLCRFLTSNGIELIGIRDGIVGIKKAAVSLPR